MGESISSSDELAQAEQFSARLGLARDFFHSGLKFPYYGSKISLID